MECLSKYLVLCQLVYPRIFTMCVRICTIVVGSLPIQRQHNVDSNGISWSVAVVMGSCYWCLHGWIVLRIVFHQSIWSSRWSHSLALCRGAYFLEHFLGYQLHHQHFLVGMLDFHLYTRLPERWFLWLQK